jgi:mannosyltransferase
MKQTVKAIIGAIITYRHLDMVVLATGIVIYATIVLSTTTQWSIWFDEAFSAYIVRFDLAAIAQYTAADVHPPMYYWILKGWTSLFGTTELGFRSLSLVCGAVAISFGFFIVKKLFNRRAAWISLLLLVISPMLIRYGQETRMYTMAAAIVMAAIYTLIVAETSKKRLPWILYGVLLAIGMWTHYFVAVAWLSHWVWRGIVVWQQKYRGKKFFIHFFTKHWVIAHLVAVVLFIPWIPSMFAQLFDIQTGWFWIEPVSADSFTSYLTTVLFFTEHGDTSPWLGFLFVCIGTLLLYLTLRTYTKTAGDSRRSFLLLASIAIVPVVLVFLASLPPLRSSFLERYLMPSIVGFSLLTGVVIAIGTQKLKPILQITVIIIVSGAMLIGVFETQRVGNFNKNANVSISTKDVIAGIAARGFDNEPIVARSPWIFYEAVFYESDIHPVYYLSSTVIGSESGSLDMLQGPDSHKIMSLESFGAEHPTVWVFGELGENEIQPPVDGWDIIQSFRIDDPVTGKKRYQAVQLRTTAMSN